MLRELPLAHAELLHELPSAETAGAVGLQVVQAQYRGCVGCRQIRPQGACVPGKALCLDCHRARKWTRWIFGADCPLDQPLPRSEGSAGTSLASPGAVSLQSLTSPPTSRTAGVDGEHPQDRHPQDLAPAAAVRALGIV